MSTTLPVPSKSALRALRNLVLGTSCTVALSVGLLTADRRRRIHAAREVRDNARKLKSTRQYHRDAAFTTNDFEEPITKHGDGLWKSRKAETSTEEVRSLQDERPLISFEPVGLQKKEQWLQPPENETVRKYTHKPRQFFHTRRNRLLLQSYISNIEDLRSQLAETDPTTSAKGSPSNVETPAEENGMLQEKEALVSPPTQILRSIRLQENEEPPSHQIPTAADDQTLEAIPLQTQPAILTPIPIGSQDELDLLQDWKTPLRGSKVVVRTFVGTAVGKSDSVGMETLTQVVSPTEPVWVREKLLSHWRPSIIASRQELLSAPASVVDKLPSITPNLHVANKRQMLIQDENPQRLIQDIQDLPFPSNLPVDLQGSHRQESQAKLARQQLLAHDVIKLMLNDSEATNIETAACLFLDKFEEDTAIGELGLHQDLVEVATKLSQYSKSKLNCSFMQSLEWILGIVVTCGAINKDTLMKFKPESIIRALLWRPGHNPRGSLNVWHRRPALAKFIESGYQKHSIARLEMACDLYTTHFKVASPHDTHSAVIRDIGKHLCIQASDHNLFESVETVFGTFSSYACHKDKAYASAVVSLVVSAHKSGNHITAVGHYNKLFVNTSPSQEEFRMATGAIGLTLLKLDDLKRAGRLLLSMLTMAEREGLKMSTTITLKNFRRYWKAYPKLDRCRALFDRLEPVLHTTNHPQQLYGAMIQNCVSTDDEHMANHYYERLRKTYPLRPMDVRIQGHLAHAKARRKDWAGVREDFRCMRNLKFLEPGPDDSWYDFERAYSATFTPVLRRYSESHSMSETEAFLLEFVEEFGVLPIPTTSQVMVERYLENREIDSVARWASYMTSTGAQLSPNFLNSILVGCARYWHFSFEEVLQVYQSVSELGDWTHGFINQETYAILRRIAMANSRPNNIEAARKTLDHLGRRIAHYFSPFCMDTTGTIKKAFINANYAKVLKLYKHAIANDLPLGTTALSEAVRAALRLYPESVEIALSLVHDAKQRGESVFGEISAISMHQIDLAKRKGSPDIMEIARVIISALELNWDRDSKKPTHIVSYIIRAMSDIGKHQEAVDFWAYVSSRDGQPRIPLDLITLTSILQAYLGSRNPTGLVWAMNMIREKKLFPDEHFKRALQVAHREERAAHPRRKTRFLQCVEVALSDTREMMFDAALERKTIRDKIAIIMEKAIEDALLVKRRFGALPTPGRRSPGDFDDSDHSIVLTPQNMAAVSA